MTRRRIAVKEDIKLLLYNCCISPIVDPVKFYERRTTINIYIFNFWLDLISHVILSCYIIFSAGGGGEEGREVVGRGCAAEMSELK